MTSSKNPQGHLSLDTQAKKRAINQVRTIVGHAQGIEKMLDEGRYCIDILKQIAAVQSSLSKVARAISESHMKHCVITAIEQGQGEEKIDELMETLKYLKYF